MSIAKFAFLFAVTILAIASTSAPAVQAQSTSVVATGLQAPTKIILTDQGNLIVAEASFGINTGRISVINRATGVRRTLLQGLPSGITDVGGTPDPSGPEGLELRGHTCLSQSVQEIPC